MLLQVSTQVDTTYLGQLDHIQNSVDSILNKVSPVPIFEGVDFCISSVTDFWISVIAVVISVLAALFGFLGYWSQRKTTMNTSKVSISSQKAQFINITRHLYRNLVCTIAVYESYRREIEAGGKRFPSEEHLLKLKFSPEDVVHIEKYLNHCCPEKFLP